MSERVVELPAGRARANGPAEFERTPPQDIAAEQSVLGGMLLSKDAIADVVEVLRPADFYRPAHQTIFDVVIDLYGKGEPADPITVSDSLSRMGELARVGGAPYLHTLMSSVPTAANAGYYARIVAEQAVLRRLVEAGTRIVQLGYSTGMGDVDDIVDRAQQTIYEVTERRSGEDYAVLEDLMAPTMDELEAIGSRGGSLSGVPTGFADLDSLTNGLHPGQFVVVAARPGVGKALALDTPLPTPSGWTSMAEVCVGDQLLDAAGRPTTVVGATEVLVGRPCYEVAFADGTRVVADAWHEWLVGAGGSPGGAAILTTEQLAAGLAAGTPLRVPACRPLSLPEAELPMAPYLLGVGLVAGARSRPGDSELALWLSAAGATDAAALDEQVRRVAGAGIPAAYLRASQAQRRELLSGLVDAAGTVTESGWIQVPTRSPRVAADIAELVAGLGHQLGAAPEPGAVTFAAAEPVFRCSVPAIAHKERAALLGEAAHEVVSVRRVPSVPVRCVEVANADHMYLFGRSMIPTHNSTLGLDIARSCSIKHSLASVIFSLEMSRTEITMRLLSAEARVPLSHMRSGTMTDDDWARLARRMGEVADAPLFIDDSPNLTMMEIRAKARRLKQRHDLRLVVVDYLQLMQGNRRAENRQQEVSELSRSLKLLAKELECPVIAMSQLNRGPEQRTDKKPQLADLRESGAIEQDADMVILMYREDAFERESPRAGEADFIVAKHRNGPTTTITVSSQLHYSRFVDMASG